MALHLRHLEAVYVYFASPDEESYDVSFSLSYVRLCPSARIHPRVPMTSHIPFCADETFTFYLTSIILFGVPVVFHLIVVLL